MKDFLDKTLLSFLTSKHKKEKFFYNLLPHFFMEIMEKYLRLDVEGAENLPKGPALIAPNHSGFSGLDAMVLAHELPKQTLVSAKILTHKLWFSVHALGKQAEKLGFIEASKENGIKELERGHMVVLFPEGEAGNFKPTKQAYEIQTFKRGIVRMALQTGAPIIPTVVIGAEETHINLTKLNFGKHLQLPLPLNVIPLPALWRIRFLKPFQLPHDPKLAGVKETVHKYSYDLQKIVQNAVNEELEKRPGVFIKRPPFLKKVFKKYTRL